MGRLVALSLMLIFLCEAWEKKSVAMFTNFKQRPWDSSFISNT